MTSVEPQQLIDLMGVANSDQTSIVNLLADDTAARNNRLPGRENVRRVGKQMERLFKFRLCNSASTNPVLA